MMSEENGSGTGDGGLEALASKLNIALLETVREGQYGTRDHKKMVVRHVLPAILAARKVKLRFHEIAQVLNANGFEIKASTLRVYFTELMSEEATSATRQHGNKVAQMRRLLDTQNIKEGATKSFDAVFVSPKPSVIPVRGEKHDAQEDNRKQPDNGAENSVVGNTQPMPAIAKPPRGLSVNQPAVMALPETLEELERRSSAVEDHAAITQDVILREAHVFNADGTPFAGTLNKKYLILLKSNGRVIAASKGRTSDKAVKIRDDV
jgi:hypothetical protein